MGDFVGIDIGGTKIAAGVVRADGTVLATHRTATPRGDRAVLDAISEAADSAVKEAGKDWPDITGVGIGAPGIVDPTRGAWSGSTNLVLDQPPLPLADELRRRLGCLCHLENDVKAAALGEYRFGGGAPVSSFFYISVGTGMSGALVLEGELYRGEGLAGEIGHLPLSKETHPCECGQRGCLETVASGRALERWGREALAAGRTIAFEGRAPTDRQEITGSQMIEAARAGDPVALQLVERLADGIGLAVVVAFWTYDPDRVAVGGGVIAGGGDLLDEKIRRAVDRISPMQDWTHRLVRARLTQEAGIVGAAAVAAGFYSS